jgi:hypothetical protein
MKYISAILAAAALAVIATTTQAQAQGPARSATQASPTTNSARRPSLRTSLPWAR